MMYSAWNQAKRAYDYYEAGGPEPTANVEKPGHLVSRTLGSTIDQAAWPIPAGARLVGSGEHAIGRVGVPAAVSARAALGSIAFDAPPIVKVGLLLGAAGLAYKYLLPRKLKR